MEIILEGKTIQSGIAIGKIHFYEKKQRLVRRGRIQNVDEELERYEKAKNNAISQLKELHKKAIKEVGEINAQIFEVHVMMLEDEDYNDSVYHIIRNQKFNAEYAVATTGDKFSRMFSSMEDEYFRARASDIKDISERVLSILGDDDDTMVIDQPSIIIARELAPSETVQMEKKYLLGFVTQLGTVNSHTAILAGNMNIPAISEIEISKEWHGKMAIIDGFQGRVIVEPSPETCAEYQKKLQEELEKQELLCQYKGKETVTKSGKKIHLYANIGDCSDLAEVLNHDAEGIGLLRSEFLYLKEEEFPSEEKQFQVYKQIAEAMIDKMVIIRTMDIGVDKKVDYFQLEEEENPALGYRAIRICLTQPQIFKTQLRAILRASVYGNIAIMYPMITSINEVMQIKMIVEEVKTELDDLQIPYGKIKQGIMIETPAAVMISDELAKLVDFFSIGTNDLTQYTLAIDRQNPKLGKFYDSHHPAILKMIQMAVENAHKAGIWVGICGELAADAELTQQFVEMGVDELSVAPANILQIRKVIREMD